MDYICIETDGYMQDPSDTPLKPPRTVIAFTRTKCRSGHRAKRIAETHFRVFANVKNALPDFSDRAFYYLTADPSF